MAFKCSSFRYFNHKKIKILLLLFQFKGYGEGGEGEAAQDSASQWAIIYDPIEYFRLQIHLKNKESKENKEK